VWSLQIPMQQETRRRLTRLLCWAAIVGAASTVICFAGLFLALFSQASPTKALEALPIFGAAAASFALYQGARLGLRLWRRCDQCSYHLFPIWSGMWAEMSWPRAAYFPNHRAPQFLGSYGWGAIISVAFRGVTHCMACGHADGPLRASGAADGDPN
jgi:hypothetical protein